MKAYTYVERGRFELRDKPRPVLVDARDEAVRVGGRLVVERHHVGAGVEVLLDLLVGVAHHEVDVHGEVRGGLHGAQHVRAEADVGHEVAVHDVKVDEVGGGDVGHVGPEAGEVGGEHRRRDLDLLEHQSLSLSCPLMP